MEYRAIDLSQLFRQIRVKALAAHRIPASEPAGIRRKCCGHHIFLFPKLFLRADKGIVQPQPRLMQQTGNLIQRLSLRQ